MLNISPEYQLERFKRRLEIPGKNWKFNPGDLEERKHWTSYMQAFETAIERCASEQAPWYIIPAENRRFRDALISQIILKKLEQMDPSFPEPEYDPSVYSSSTIS